MKVGVIGTGNMGENHVRTYLSLQDHCQFVGIYDSDENKRREIAHKYKVKSFQSIEELLHSVDAVSVAVPTPFHYEIGLRCIAHRVHVLMEKPMTNTVSEATHLHKKAIEAGVKLQVGHIELFNPLIKALIKEVKNRKIIGVDLQRMGMYDNRIKNVDVVKDLMIHDMYILQELLKGTFMEFYALGKVIENTPKHAVVIIKSPHVIAQLTASFKSKKKIRTIRVITEDALIETDILKSEMKITKDADVQTITFNNKEQPLTSQLLHFIRCITFDKKPFVSGKDGIKVLRITNKVSDAIYHSKPSF